MRSVYGREEIFALTAEQAVVWDRAAREQHGISERLLMENAGRAVAAVVNKLFPRGRILALVGSGHNGGDALIAARILHTGDRDIAWRPVSARLPALDVLEGVDVPRVAEGDDEALRTADIIIDGVLGTGARGAPRDDVAAIIRAANAHTHAIAAVDLPSGVDPSTGAVPGEAIRARVTVTFGAAKTGLLLHPARAHCGRLIVAEIGFPPLADPPAAQLITPEWAWRRLPRRAPNAHKGSSGRVLLVVGSCGMAGAAVIAGRAAVRAGAGLVRIASASDNRLIVQTAVPEATFYDRDGDLPFDGVHALVAGCGLGTNAAARSALERALSGSEGLPTILDADALNLLAHAGDALSTIARSRGLVITPHVRELSRISGLDEAEILRHPLEVAHRFAEQTQATVLLKGQPSVVAARGMPILINTVGSSDTAAGGMGDQLAGMIGAMLGAGVPAREAAALALFFGGRAADLARRGRSLSPNDVSDHLYHAFRSPGRRHGSLGLPFVTFDQPPRW